MRTSRKTSDILLTFKKISIRELTALEFKLFCAIKPQDLIAKLNSNSTSTQQQEDDTPIGRMIHRFNRMTYWVVTEIVTTNSRKHQARVLTKFIRVAQKCLRLGNFNSFLEIICGLNHSAVQRLRSLWERLPSDVVQSFETLSHIGAPDHNYRGYRKELAKRKGPTLPYLGVFLRDLRILYEGNTRYLPDGSVNADLIEMAHQIVNACIGFQKEAFPFGSKPGPVLHYLNNLVIVTDEVRVIEFSIYRFL